MSLLIEHTVFQEERCNRAEAGIGEVTKLQGELDLLQNALRDIAHAVLHDAETRENHVHLTPQASLPPKYIYEIIFLNKIISVFNLHLCYRSNCPVEVI